MTVLVTKDNAAYVLNHNVNYFMADSDLRALMKQLRVSKDHVLESSLLVSNMGIKSDSEEFSYIRLGSDLRELSLNLFPLPERKEYGYHAKI